MLTPLHLIFYLFAVMAVISGVMVITTRHPVRSVLSLVVTFFAMSGIWMLLQAEFLSLILLLVYVGAVMTLFLFVVMMLNIDQASKRGGFVRYLPFGIIIILLVTGILIASVGPTYFGNIETSSSQTITRSNTRELGLLLYTQYAYPFEIAGILLLTAIIAAITLTHRAPVRRKVQNLNKQLQANPQNSVRLVKMRSEPKQEGSA